MNFTRKITQKQGCHIEKLNHSTHTEPAHRSAQTSGLSVFILKCCGEGTKCKTPGKVSRSLTAMPLHTIELLSIFCVVCENWNFSLTKQILKQKQLLAQQMYLLTACKICFYIFLQLTTLDYLQVQNYNLHVSSNCLQKFWTLPQI